MDGRWTAGNKLEGEGCRPASERASERGAPPRTYIHTHDARVWYGIVRSGREGDLFQPMLSVVEGAQSFVYPSRGEGGGGGGGVTGGGDPFPSLPRTVRLEPTSTLRLDSMMGSMSPRVTVVVREVVVALLKLVFCQKNKKRERSRGRLVSALRTKPLKSHLFFFFFCRAATTPTTVLSRRVRRVVDEVAGAGETTTIPNETRQHSR